jgi:RES domain-containing protein
VISCFRLSSRYYPSNSGEGAALNGGRWNPVGVEAIYAASTLSLAALEILVHFSVLPRHFVLTEIRIPPEVHVEVLKKADLPVDWQTLVPSATTQKLGRQWSIELRSAVLSVPSTIVPVDRNYILNPMHPDFERLKFLPSKPFRFDRRLK